MRTERIQQPLDLSRETVLRTAAGAAGGTAATVGIGLALRASTSIRPGAAGWTQLALTGAAAGTAIGVTSGTTAGALAGLGASALAGATFGAAFGRTAARGAAAGSIMTTGIALGALAGSTIARAAS